MPGDGPALPRVLAAAAAAPGRSALEDQPAQVLLGMTVELLVPLGVATRWLELPAVQVPAQAEDERVQLEVTARESAAQIAQLLWFALLREEGPEPQLDVPLALVENVVRRSVASATCLPGPARCDLVYALGARVSDAVIHLRHDSDRWMAAVTGGIGRAVALHMLTAPPAGRRT